MFMQKFAMERGFTQILRHNRSYAVQWDVIMNAQLLLHQYN